MYVNEDTSVDTAHELGDGPTTVICLHGWFGSSSGWGQGFVEALDTETFRYEFMDYKGYGERRGSGGPYTLDEIAKDVLELADDIGAEKFALIGHSMGATAMLKVLTQAPERVLAVVGINPVSASGTPLDDGGRELFSSAAEDDNSRASIIDITTGNRLSAWFIDQVVHHSRAHSDQEAFADYFTAWCDTDHAADVPVDAVPALAIVGEHDGSVTEDVVRATWGPIFPNGEIEVMGNAGHYPMYETPIRLATVVESFLETLTLKNG